MHIINKSKNTILANNAVIADTVFKRVKGLLGRKDFKEGEALIIKPASSIHTFFMRFPIDVIFVDAHNKVIKAISHLLPFRITGIYFRACFVIELPARTVEKTSTQTGDQISFRDAS